MLAPAERIDAIVEMKQPGVWVFGSTEDSMREMGMGIVIEYAGQRGTPQWSKPPSSTWDYTVFGTNAATPEPDQRFNFAFDLACFRTRALSGPRFWAIQRNGGSTLI